MTPLSQSVLRMRINATVGVKGRQSREKLQRLAAELRHTDIARFLQVSPSLILQVGRGDRPMSEDLQHKLTALFLAWDREELRKAPTPGGGYELVRVRLPASVKPPARATIDVSGGAPRINWSR